MSGMLLLVRSAAAARARVAGVVAVAAGVVVGAAVEVVEAVEVVAVVGVVAGVGALLEAVVAAVGVAVVAAIGVMAVGLELLHVEVREVARGSSSSVGARPRRPCSFVSGLHLPSFSANLVGTTALQDSMVTTTTPGGQRVSICMCTRTSRHLATFTRRPGLSLYTLATEPPQVAASAQVSASGPVAPPCSCCFLSHQTLRWHHHFGHPSLPRLRGMDSCLLFASLPRSLPALPPSPDTPCLPCVEGRQRAAPHSSSFPPASAPLQTITWTCGAQPALVDKVASAIFCCPLPATRAVPPGPSCLASALLLDFCRGEGILQSFTLPASPQKNGIAERRIGLVMELNLWPRVSLPETSPTLRWTGKVGNASVFRVWSSRAFVRDTSADKLSARAIPCFFHCFPLDATGLQFYHPTSRHVLPSQDVTFDESVPFYGLFPYRSAPPLPPQLFLAPDPLPGTMPVEVAGDSGAARGAASWGVEPGGAEPGGAESEGAKSGVVELGGAEPVGVEPGGAEPASVEPGGAECKGTESGGAEPRGTASSRGPAGASPRLSPQPKPLSPQEVPTCLGGAGVTAGAGGTGGAVVADPGGAHTGGIGAAETGRVRGVGAGGSGAGDHEKFGGAGAGGTGAGGARARGAGAVDPGARVAGVGGAVSGGTGAGGTLRPRPYFVPLLQQVLGLPSSPVLTPPFLCPPPNQSQPLLQPASPLPAPSPFTEKTGGHTKHRKHESRPASRVRAVRTGRHIPHAHPPPVPGTHAMALRPSSVPLRVPLTSPPESSLPVVPDPESDLARATSPTVSRLLATIVTDPSFESTAASALVAKLVDFAAACRLDYASALVAESESASPPSVTGECALGTDVLEDRQEDFECLATAVPRFASMLLAPEGDRDAPDIPTPRSYAEAITGPYSSQWQAAMDAEMASWKCTGIYVDAVTPFWHDYELPSRDFNTAFLQGSLNEEIWLRHPLGFTRSFPAGTQWSLRWPVYGLRQALRKWHDTLRTTLAALGFTPSTTDPSLFLRTDTSLPPFYILVYVDNLVIATAETEGLNHVKSELQKRHTCADLGELRSYLGLQITQDTAWCTITVTQSHMVHQVLQCFGFQFSSPQPTPLSTGHTLSAPPSDESVEPSGPYPELVGCLMYLMTCTRPDLAYRLSLLARYVAPGRHRKRSSQGYTFSLGSGSISWRSTRSSSVLSSSCEAEIYAGAMAAQELRWLTYLLTDLGE
ncbi:unnamed protein product [Closterium sp. NIES-53]